MIYHRGSLPLPPRCEELLSRRLGREESSAAPQEQCQVNLPKAGSLQRCSPPPPAQRLPPPLTRGQARGMGLARPGAGRRPLAKGSLPAPAQRLVPGHGRRCATCRGPAPGDSSARCGRGRRPGQAARTQQRLRKTRVPPIRQEAPGNSLSLSGTGSARPGLGHFPSVLQGKRLLRAVARACDPAALGSPRGHARSWRRKSSSTYLLATWIPLTVSQASPKAKGR